MAETALVSAIFAFLPELGLIALLVPPLHEGFHGAWGWALQLAVAVPLVLTPLVAAVAGGILAWQARPSRPVLRWLLIGMGAKATTLLCGALLLFLPGPQGPVRWMVFCLAALVLSVAAAAFPVPMMWAVIGHAVSSRRRPRIITRIVLAVLIVAALVLWARFAVLGFIERAQSVAALSVSPSGRVYAATGAGIFAAGPKSTTLRYLRCGSLGTPATTVVADARNAALVWAGLAMANALTTRLVESRDAGSTWHPVAGLPPADYILSAPSAIYAKHDHAFDTLWVNRSGQVGDWERRPLKLSKVEAQGRVRVSPSVMAASSERPGLVMLAAECRITEPAAGATEGRDLRALQPAPPRGAFAPQPAAETWRGALFRTRDFGSTWQSVPMPLLVENNAGEQIDDIAIIPGKPEIVAAATWWGFLISSDEGDHWRRLKRPQGEHPEVSGAPTVPPTIYLLVEGGLYASHDLGRTWRDVRGGVECIAVSPADPRTIYAGSWDGQWWDRKLRRDVAVTGGVYRSRDAGKTWRRLRYSYLPFGAER
jgi:hypothetical protein